MTIVLALTALGTNLILKIMFLHGDITLRNNKHIAIHAELAVG
jgi:hypothetical protein